MNKFFQWFVDLWNKKPSENNVEIKIEEDIKIKEEDKLEDKQEEKEEIKPTEVQK